MDDSDDNDEMEADTENDTENEEDEKDHCSAVIHYGLHFSKCLLIHCYKVKVVTKTVM